MSVANCMDHKNLVVIHYNQYAGGKFFINCLAHHPGILPGLCIASEHGHTHDHWIFDKNLPDYDIEDYKIQRINRSIPPADKMQDWAGREAGCIYFWGHMFYVFVLGNHLNVAPGAESIELLQNNICFIVNHQLTPKIYQMSKNLWPRARHITLYNSKCFQDHAAPLKNPTQKHPPLYYNSLPMDIPGMFYLDVGNTFHDAEKVKQATIDCLAWMGIDRPLLQFNFDSYVKKYVDLHQGYRK